MNRSADFQIGVNQSQQRADLEIGAPPWFMAPMRVRFRRSKLPLQVGESDFPK